MASFFVLILVILACLCAQAGRGWRSPRTGSPAGRRLAVRFFAPLTPVFIATQIRQLSRLGWRACPFCGYRRNKSAEVSECPNCRQQVLLGRQRI